MKVLIGNIFESNAETIVNTVNCVGVMGKGIAKEFKKRYPQMYKEYALLCKENKVNPGEPYLYKDLLGNSVINFPTKKHWRSPSKLSYIVSGLKWFCDNYRELDISSVAFPPLGCGNGGLRWEVVGPIMYYYLNQLPIDVEIYAPYGTKLSSLTHDYLENNLIHNFNEVLGTHAFPFNNKWMLILEVIKQVNSRKYNFHVGRTMFQKICFALADCGVDMGFVFVKGMYGPYCKKAEQVITVFSNANLLTERPVGKMIEMHVTDDFSFCTSEFSEKDLSAVNKTVDLFSRIKSTAQAELVTTVIFAFRTLSLEYSSLSEMDIYNYVLDWKPHWKDSKSEELSDTIRNLAMLQWISPFYSESLPTTEDDLL